MIRLARISVPDISCCIGCFIVTSLLCVASMGEAVADEEPVERHAAFNRAQTYYLHVPAGYTPEKAWPLFIVIHGTYASGVGDFTMWRPYADQEGFILLAPNFTDVAEFDTFRGGTDQRLVRLIKELAAQYHIDVQKILLSGFSRGGIFACRFALAHPALIHTVAVFNGAPVFPNVTERAQLPSRPQFYLAGGSEDNSPRRLPPFARALEAHGYRVVDVYIARGIGHSIPSRAILDTLRLFRQMAAE